MAGWRSTMLLAAVALAAGPAAAEPTSVYNVPVAEQVAFHEVSVQVQQDVIYLHGAAAPRTTSLLTEFGLSHRVEAGLDLNYLGGNENVEGDIKYRLVEPETHDWGLAIGVYNVGPETAAFSYAVATSRTPPARVKRPQYTFGVGSDGRFHALAGVTLLIATDLTAIMDWISAQGGAFAAGFTYRPGGRYLIAGGYQNTYGPDQEVIQFLVGYTRPF
jgi:hypothetical protein